MDANSAFHTILQQMPMVGIILIIGYFWRKDITKQQENDRADKAGEADKNRAHVLEITASSERTVANLVQNFREANSAIIAKFAETERLSEARFSLMLDDKLKNKGGRDQ